MSEKTVKKFGGVSYELRGIKSTGCPDCAAHRDPAACNALAEGGACAVSAAAHWVKVLVEPAGSLGLSPEKVDALGDRVGTRPPFGDEWTFTQSELREFAAAIRAGEGEEPGQDPADKLAKTEARVAELVARLKEADDALDLEGLHPEGPTRSTIRRALGGDA